MFTEAIDSLQNALFIRDNDKNTDIEEEELEFVHIDLGKA